MKKCNNCGAQNSEDNVFCSSCGQRLETAVPPVPSDTIEVTFQQPYSFLTRLVVFHVKVDNSASYELRNGGEIKIPVSPGQHFVEISASNMPRRKKYQFHTSNSTTFICKWRYGVGILAVPVKVTDSSGREY